MVCGARPSPRAREPGPPMTKGRRKWTSQPKQREKELSLPLLFCSFGALKGLDDAPCIVGGGGSAWGICFIQSTCRSAALLPKRPRSPTQKERFSSHLGLPGPGQGDAGNGPSQPWKTAKSSTNPDVWLRATTPYSLSQREFWRPESKLLEDDAKSQRPGDTHPPPQRSHPKMSQTSSKAPAQRRCCSGPEHVAGQWMTKRVIFKAKLVIATVTVTIKATINSTRTTQQGNPSRETEAQP